MAEDSITYAIVCEGLAKKYNEIRAVDGLNLHVPSGAVYGFLGRNGAGKTTTIKMLLGLRRPTAGSARVQGFDIYRDRLSILNHTAFAGESTTLYEWMNLEELIRFSRSYHLGWSEEAAEKYSRILEIPASKPWGKLSRGNRMKVALLLALSQGAKLIILDEPTTGLDPVSVDQLLNVLASDQSEKRQTIFFSSHQLSEVEQIADWVGIIDKGKVIFEAKVSDIRDRFRVVLVVGNPIPDLNSDNVLATDSSGGVTKYLISKRLEEFVNRVQAASGRVIGVKSTDLRKTFLSVVGRD